MTLPAMKSITSGASVENWLEVTRGWNIYPSTVGIQLSSKTEGYHHPKKNEYSPKQSSGKQQSST